MPLLLGKNIDFPGQLLFSIICFRCLKISLKGNPVKFRNGPAAVTGDENCEYATDRNIGKAQRVERTGSQKTYLIRDTVSPWTRVADQETRTQQGIPGSFNKWSGFFVSGHHAFGE